jgi:hypothetical protein
MIRGSLLCDQGFLPAPKGCWSKFAKAARLLGDCVDAASFQVETDVEPTLHFGNAVSVPNAAKAERRAGPQKPSQIRDDGPFLMKRLAGGFPECDLSWVAPHAGPRVCERIDPKIYGLQIVNAKPDTPRTYDPAIWNSKSAA